MGAGRLERRRWLMLAALPWLAGRAAPARADGPAASETWPARPVRILVAYPPGGVSDMVARALADRLAVQIGVPVVVENRPGGSGTLAMQAVARALPDGHTLCFAAATALAWALDAGHGGAAGERWPVAPVAGVMRTPVLIVGTRALQATTFAGMLRQGRSRAEGIRWATTGEGTTGHRVLDRVRHASGARIVHVPYKGGGQQVNDALGGHFEVLSTNVAAPQLDAIRAGRLKPLAVGSPHRLPVLPEVPTLAELGFARANLGSLFGLFAPLQTPAALIERINGQVNSALSEPVLRQRLLAVNNVPMEGAPAAFAEQIALELER
ncbi:tripartite tricarboxylate transporter substrate binding protein [Aquincola sp. MAHUQ-54]|uniref:Tripartite tricarboxylate transporter substrate binding protein n=1 Tax=Aquincola agrisoli TaxID=3119538 RepID=A0AAW9QDB6_9BURK